MLALLAGLGLLSSAAQAGVCFTLNGEERWDPRGTALILVQYEGQGLKISPCTVQFMKRNRPKQLEEFSIEDQSASGLAVAVLRAQENWEEQLATLEQMARLRPAVGGTQRRVLGKFEAWTAYQGAGPVSGLCHAEVLPNNKYPAPFDHGNVSLNIAAYPGQDSRDEVILLTGIDIAEGSDVEVTVEPENLKSDGRTARAYTPDQSARLIRAMQGATNVAVSVKSVQGPVFKYGFPLDGFQDALGQIRDCTASQPAQP